MMANPYIPFPRIPAKFGYLAKTLSGIHLFLDNYATRYPYRDPFTQTPLTPAGRVGKSQGAQHANLEMRRFMNWCHKEALNLAPENFTAAVISHYFVYLGNHSGLSKKTMKSSATFLRVFFRFYFRKMGIQLPNPVSKNIVQVPFKLSRRSIGERELRVFLNRVGNHDVWTRQIQLVFRMTYEGAARIGEILNLHLKDLNIRQPSTPISGFDVIRKGGKTRELYLSKETEDLLEKHLNARGVSSPEQPVFPGLRCPDRPMGRSVLMKTIRRHLKDMGIQRKCYGTHIMRHSAAKHMIARNADPYVVADYLSHSSIGLTIGTYATATDIEVARAYRRTMPKFDYRKLKSSIKYFNLDGARRGK